MILPAALGGGGGFWVQMWAGEGFYLVPIRLGMHTFHCRVIKTLRFVGMINLSILDNAVAVGRWKSVFASGTNLFYTARSQGGWSWLSTSTYQTTFAWWPWRRIFQCAVYNN